MRPRITESEYQSILEARGKGGNVLIIGDLHEPFTKVGYLGFCIGLKQKYHCTDVIFIGDIIDNHYSSFHPSDPDGFGAGEELERAKARLQGWHDAFPNARVMLGNHDRIPARKAFDAGLSKDWIKSYSEALNVPTWSFMDSYEKDGILYVHGDGAGHAVTRSRKSLQSVVQGHFHSRAYVEYTVGTNFKIFGMQVGCGVNDKSYAMAYGKNHPKSAISAGVIIDNGRTPIIEMMEL